MGDDGVIRSLPLSVWPTGQKQARWQRRGRYLPETTAHPAKMLPAIAAHAIQSYTHPGELVLDPMCGSGTTLVEAVHLGRDALGVECEPRWAQLARGNVARARTHGAPGHARVHTRDARTLGDWDADTAGRAALVVTSPPYGSSTHGQMRASHHGDHPGIVKWDHRYSDHPAGNNLAHAGLEALLAGFTDILTGCRRLLAPGGIVVITTRPFRHQGELVDFPSAVMDTGQAAGLEPLDRLVALLCGLRGDKLVPRASFFQLTAARKAQEAGIPLHVIAHEDVLVLRNPESRRSSGKPKDPPEGGQ